MKIAPAEEGGPSASSSFPPGCAAARHRQRDAEADGEEQHLQEIAVHEGARPRFRNDADQEGGDRLVRGLLDIIFDRAGLQRGRIDVHAAPGCTTLATTRPNDQRDGGEEQEIGKGLAATRPTSPSPRMPAMPVTMVRKITGAMIILTSLMKASPSGFSATPLKSYQAGIVCAEFRTIGLSCGGNPHSLRT
jgi:hypothetical protein